MRTVQPALVNAEDWIAMRARAPMSRQFLIWRSWVFFLDSRCLLDVARGLPFRADWQRFEDEKLNTLYWLI